MPIKTEVEQVEKSMVVLTVEVPFDELGESIEKAYRDVAQKVKIAGFRKGKAPHAIIDQMVGKDAVLQEAMNDVIPAFYPQAVESSGIEPVTIPQIDVVQLSDNQPLIFKARVEVKPEVKLGAYKKLEIDEIEQKPVAEEVNKQLERLRNKFATLEVVKGRAAKSGDFVLIDYEGYIQGKPFEGGRGSDYMLELGSGTFIPGFEDQLIGAKAGSATPVKLVFPADYQAENLAGAEAAFDVKIKEIKTKKQPKADDEFANNVSKFDTLKEFKADLKKAAIERQKKERETGIRMGALDKMVELSEVELPAGMIGSRVEEMIQDFEDRIQETQKITLQGWLAQSGIDMSVLRQSYQDEAQRTTKTELVIEAVMKAEKIEATDEDAEKEIKRLAEGAKKDINELKEEIKKRDGFGFLKNRLAVNKTVDFLATKVKVKKKDDVNESSTDSD
ncbi:MAG: trigger factor [Actinomycetota bacterium]|nr:trigger factor [Actinomycetota bacterium]